MSVLPKPAMSGLVILDGPDAVGKTTLARHLLGDDQDGYVHLTYNPNWINPNCVLWKIQHYSILKAQIRLNQGKLTVIDRHWMSEQVYARIYRSGSDLNTECQQWDRKVQSMRGVYVICAPEPHSAFERHAASFSVRHEMYEPDNRTLQVAVAFRDLWYGSDEESEDYAAQLARQGGMIARRDALLYDINVHGDDLDSVCWRVHNKLQRLQ